MQNGIKGEDMGKGIKTREIKKDIRVLDKTVIATQHMRWAYEGVKDKRERKADEGDDTPVEYAENRLKDSSSRVADKALYQVRRQGKKAIKSRRATHKTTSEGEDVPPVISDTEPPAFSSAGSEEQICMPTEQVKKQLPSKNVSSQLSTPISECYPNKTIRNASMKGEPYRATAPNSVKSLQKTSGRTYPSVAGRFQLRINSKKTVKTTEHTTHIAIKTPQEKVKSRQLPTKVPRMKAKESIRTAKQITGHAAKTTGQTMIAVVKEMIEAMQQIFYALGAGSGIAVFIFIIVILFSGVLCMIGGDNSNGVSPLSAEVEAYTTLIRQYANQYGIGEYVELIKAVMMQESKGQGLDPMQSSEGAFNQRYPREPNGITDPVYSIECGVQEIKAVLASAEVENPVDMEHIKLALQGYNFGNGYISWAKSNYGGYTVANAIEFSDMMAQRLGWGRYGDKQYVPHVLRYYIFGRIPNGIGNQAIVQIALAQEGNSGDIYWLWYGFNSRVEWCACFVSWCASQCGYIESGIFPKFASCAEGVAWFSTRGQFRDGSYLPAAGDLIFFDWDNDGSVDHVGIVESVSEGNVNTIEGNSGDQCRRRNYAIGDGTIYGYGVLGN